MWPLDKLEVRILSGELCNVNRRYEVVLFDYAVRETLFRRLGHSLALS